MSKTVRPLKIPADLNVVERLAVLRKKHATGYFRPGAKVQPEAREKAAHGKVVHLHLFRADKPDSGTPV
ncbi:hypothetical protein [Propionivibrio limicola]|uniref:hypothetical protein n=1 Tax=Propionivibrio limicola TaxID=167645 RepID=UPI00129210A1|nr:hypothetical protein [Propionivibrio limicola]